MQVAYYEFAKEEVDAALEGQRQGQLGLMRVPSSIRNEGAFRILMVIELS
jgi:hypothetical protein